MPATRALDLPPPPHPRPLVGHSYTDKPDGVGAVSLGEDHVMDDSGFVVVVDADADSDNDDDDNDDNDDDDDDVLPVTECRRPDPRTPTTTSRCQ